MQIRTIHHTPIKALLGQESRDFGALNHRRRASTALFHCTTKILLHKSQST